MVLRDEVPAAEHVAFPHLRLVVGLQVSFHRLDRGLHPHGLDREPEQEFRIALLLAVLRDGVYMACFVNDRNRASPSGRFQVPTLVSVGSTISSSAIKFSKAVSLANAFISPPPS